MGVEHQPQSKKKILKVCKKMLCLSKASMGVYACMHADAKLLLSCHESVYPAAFFLGHPLMQLMNEKKRVVSTR